MPTMTMSQLSILAFAISSCFVLTSIEGRLHGLATSNKLLAVSHISLPPALAPQAASPSYNARSPGPSPSPSPSHNPSTVFSVLSFGAMGDGVADDTEAFKMAWDTACQTDESSIFLAPHGYMFLVQPTIFTGPCKSGLVFQIDGTIVAPNGPQSWPRSTNKRQWLVFYKINEVLIQGSGVIDGRGKKWWDLPCKPHKGINGTTLLGPCDSPVAIRFFMCSNLTVQGFKVKNSPQFHFRFDNCQNIHVQMLRIKSPAQSPNTDGIHIENTYNVRIYNSDVSSGNPNGIGLRDYFSCLIFNKSSESPISVLCFELPSGDDCVSIGAGCYDVDIRNVTCGPSHGISIGSLGIHNSRACVFNIMVSDSIIKQSDNGVRIKTWQGGYGSVSKVTFQNIHMDNVRNPIIIDQYYCLTKNCTNQTSAVYISDVLYTSIKGTYDVRSPPLNLACSNSVPCTDLALSDIELLPAQGQLVANPSCSNAYGAMQTLTIPPVPCLLEGDPPHITQTSIDQCVD